MPWSAAINEPGAAQMQYGRALIESRPFLTRIPDDSIIATDRVPTSVPGAGRYRFVATRDESGSFAMVYAPVGRKFSVNMDKITGTEVKAWWFNPRDGKASALERSPAKGRTNSRRLITGEMTDWILVLDDASRNFPTPGSKKWDEK